MSAEKQRVKVIYRDYMGKETNMGEISIPVPEPAAKPEGGEGRKTILDNLAKAEMEEGLYDREPIEPDTVAAIVRRAVDQTISFDELERMVGRDAIWRACSFGVVEFTPDRSKICIPQGKGK